MYVLLILQDNTPNIFSSQLQILKIHLQVPQTIFSNQFPSSFSIPCGIHIPHGYPTSIDQYTTYTSLFSEGSNTNNVSDKRKSRAQLRKTATNNKASQSKHTTPPRKNHKWAMHALTGWVSYKESRYQQQQSVIMKNLLTTTQQQVRLTLWWKWIPVCWLHREKDIRK